MVLVKQAQGCILAVALLGLVFMMTTNTALINLWWRSSTANESFTKFGVLYASIANFSIIYIDKEWLVLDGTRGLQAIDIVGSARAGKGSALNDTSKNPRKFAYHSTDPRTGGSAFRKLESRETALQQALDMRNDTGIIDHPFYHNFPFYAWYGEKPAFSLAQRSDYESATVQLFYVNSLVNKIGVHYICFDEKSSTPWPFQNRTFLTDDDGTLGKIRLVQVPLQDAGDEGSEVTFFLYLIYNGSDFVIKIGYLDSTEWIAPKNCSRNDFSVRDVEFQLLGSVVSPCDQINDYFIVPPSAYSASSVTHSEFAILVVILCDYELMITKISGSFSPLLPLFRPTTPLTIVSNSTPIASAANLTMRIHHPFAATELTTLLLSNFTELESVVSACVISLPNLWNLNASELLQRDECTNVALDIKQEARYLAVSPKGDQLIVGYPLHGISRFFIQPGACEGCPGILDPTVNKLIERTDGVVGDYYVTNIDPGSLALENITNRILFYLDISTGNVRYLSVDGEDDVDRVHIPHFLLDLENPQLAPRSLSMAPNMGKIVVADFSGRSIAALARHKENYTLSVERIFQTRGKPFDIDAAVGATKVTWTEPGEARLQLGDWAWADEIATITNVVTLINHTAVTGVAYSQYFGRIYATVPGSGRVISVSPQSPRVSTHFQASSDFADAALRALRPYYIVVDETSGSVYFNAMPAPNLTGSDECYINADFDTTVCPHYFRPPSSVLGNPRSTGSTIWLMKKRPFSTLLKYTPRPFYTNPDTIITFITKSAGLLVFVEIPAPPEINMSARICTLPLLSLTEESLTYNWRVRGPQDVSVILDWTSATPSTMYAPIGETNLWEPEDASSENLSSSPDSRILGWIAFSLLVLNISCALVYNGFKHVQTTARRPTMSWEF
eukprot:Gregarina_sp_Poly_1__1929@NODE_1504_length_3979_cov_42_233129_g996_i0_p1_GENE_NODE_1504_length_3979_cov_42_233129_g996_i0NODE_1504_length_3979_cov_42_233129_g996_i0_p1_ORF_typecomplete_len904_score97_66_NODE_1504_length_3979_cov_42_233129_g996_i08463557